MAYAIYYNGNAKILFYMVRKKVKRKRHKRYFTYAFAVYFLAKFYNFLAFFTF